MLITADSACAFFMRSSKITDAGADAARRSAPPGLRRLFESLLGLMGGGALRYIWGHTSRNGKNCTTQADLAQLVTDFARQHEQHAATLQAQLQQQAEQVELLTEQYAHIAANYKTLAELLAQA